MNGIELPKLTLIGKADDGPSAIRGLLGLLE